MYPNPNRPPMSMGVSSGPQRKQTRALLLCVACPDCSYAVHTTAQWLTIGIPICPCGMEMALANETDETTDASSHRSRLTRVAVWHQHEVGSGTDTLLAVELVGADRSARDRIIPLACWLGTYSLSVFYKLAQARIEDLVVLRTLPSGRTMVSLPDGRWVGFGEFMEHGLDQLMTDDQGDV